MWLQTIVYQKQVVVNNYIIHLSLLCVWESFYYSMYISISVFVISQAIYLNFKKTNSYSNINNFAFWDSILNCKREFMKSRKNFLKFKCSYNMYIETIRHGKQAIVSIYIVHFSTLGVWVCFSYWMWESINAVVISQ